MRATLKLALPLIVSVALVSLFYATYQVRTERRNLRNDLSRRSVVLAESLQDNVEPLIAKPLEKSSEKSLLRLVERFGQREHLKGVAVYDAQGAPSALTTSAASDLKTIPPVATRAIKEDSGSGEFFTSNNTPLHIYALPLHRGDKVAGALAVLYDTTYIETRVSLALRDSLLNALVQTLLITGLALVLVRWTFTDPLKSMTKWLHSLRAGSTQPSSQLPAGDLFEQIHKEVAHLAQDLSTARAAAQREARLRETQSSLWTAERLRASLRNKLQNQPLFVVSNREPYMHVRSEKDKSIGALVPASGLVTAIEPVLHACDGTWIAHGSGNADRETVDAHNRLRVPPDQPSYTLRRDRPSAANWTSRQIAGVSRVD